MKTNILQVDVLSNVFPFESNEFIAICGNLMQFFQRSAFYSKFLFLSVCVCVRMFLMRAEVVNLTVRDSFNEIANDGFILKLKMQKQYYTFSGT